MELPHRAIRVILGSPHDERRHVLVAVIASLILVVLTVCGTTETYRTSSVAAASVAIPTRDGQSPFGAATTSLRGHANVGTAQLAIAGPSSDLLILDN